MKQDRQSETKTNVEGEFTIRGNLLLIVLVVGGTFICRIASGIEAKFTNPRKHFVNSLGMKTIRIPAGKFKMRTPPPLLPTCAHRIPVSSAQCLSLKNRKK